MKYADIPTGTWIQSKLETRKGDERNVLQLELCTAYIGAAHQVRSEVVGALYHN